MDEIVSLCQREPLPGRAVLRRIDLIGQRQVEVTRHLFRISRHATDKLESPDRLEDRHARSAKRPAAGGLGSLNESGLGGEVDDVRHPQSRV